MDVAVHSYRPIMSQTLVNFVEAVSQKPHLEDSDRVTLERLLERIPRPNRPSIKFFTKCLHSVNSDPSSNASQLVIDMWECARAYPEYAAGDHGFETAELCIKMSNLTLLGWCLGYWGAAHCLREGAFRDPFRPSLPFVCEFLKLWLECCPKAQRLMSERDGGIVGLLEGIAWRAQDDSANPQSVGWWREIVGLLDAICAKEEEGGGTLYTPAMCKLSEEWCLDISLKFTEWQDERKKKILWNLWTICVALHAGLAERKAFWYQ